MNKSYFVHFCKVVDVVEHRVSERSFCLVVLAFLPCAHLALALAVDKVLGASIFQVLKQNKTNN